MVAFAALLCQVDLWPQFPCFSVLPLPHLNNTPRHGLNTGCLIYTTHQHCGELEVHSSNWIILKGLIIRDMNRMSLTKQVLIKKMLWTVWQHYSKRLRKVIVFLLIYLLIHIILLLTIQNAEVQIIQLQARRCGTGLPFVNMNQSWCK